MVALIQVECLEEVIRTKSFRRAALSLHISQPAVSGHIAKLERELNLTLLERGAAGSVLTPAGHRILPHLRGFAERAERIHRASKEIKGGAPTTLTIGGAPRLIYELLPVALKELSRQFVNLNVRVRRMNFDELTEAVRSGTAELGALVLATDVVLPDDIIGHPMLELGLAGVGAAPGHPVLSNGVGPIDPRELYGQPLVVVSEGRSIEFNEQILPLPTRSVVSVVDDVDVGVRLVRRGPGIILITGVTSYFADPTLLWRPLAGAPMVTVRMLHHRTRPLSEAAQAAMDLAMMWAEHYRAAFTHDPVTGRFTVDETVVEAARTRFERAVGQVFTFDETV